MVRARDALPKTLSLLGDSISTFEGYSPSGFRVYYDREYQRITGVEDVSLTWWARLMDALGVTLLVNDSYSGSLVEGVGFPAGCSERRVAFLAKGDQAFRQTHGFRADGVQGQHGDREVAQACGVSRGSSPDLIITYIGINDYGWGGASAQAAGRGAALSEALDLSTIPEKVPGLADPEALSRFATAYRVMLERIRLAFPEASVWAATLCPGRLSGAPTSTFTYRFRGIPFDAYNDAIRKAAMETGCRIADVRAQGFDYDAWDGTHPTKWGMAQLCELFALSMGLSPEPSGLLDLPSEILCDRPSCIGCSYARATGNPWANICEKYL